jgi:phosphoribosylglycinamide formyltransferase-1
MTSRKRAAVLVSGRGANMAALIAAAKRADFPAEIALVLSNRPDAAALGRARDAGVPTAVVDHTLYGKDREAFEHAAQAVLENHRIELVCLAGFMRLLTPWLVTRWTGRMLNIHPALLPAFRGLNTHERALAAGVKIHGATVHFVVPEEDSGRSSPRPQCPCATTTRRRRWPSACSPPSCGSIRSPSPSSPAAR